MNPITKNVLTMPFNRMISSSYAAEQYYKHACALLQEFETMMVSRDTLEYDKTQLKELLDTVLNENIELRKRLEISDDHLYDGIECRDETIKGLDQRCAELKAEVIQLTNKAHQYVAKIAYLEHQITALQAAPNSYQSGYDHGRKASHHFAQDWRKQAESYRERLEAFLIPGAKYRVGDRVRKVTGDYTATGEVRAVFLTTNNKIRVVVSHTAEGGGAFLHIYSEANLEHEDAKRADQ